MNQGWVSCFVVPASCHRVCTPPHECGCDAEPEKRCSDEWVRQATLEAHPRDTIVISHASPWHVNLVREYRPSPAPDPYMSIQIVGDGPSHVQQCKYIVNIWRRNPLNSFVLCHHHIYWALDNPWPDGLFVCLLATRPLTESGPWRPHSSSGYGIIQPLSIQVQSSLSNSALSCFGTKYSAALFSSSGGVWFSDHFYDTTQIILFWSNSAWKSDLSIVMAAHTGLSSCGKLTVPSLVMYTSPSFLMISKASSMSNPNNFPSATKTSTSIGHPLPTSSWTRPTPQHLRAPSPTMNTSTFFFSQEWQSALVTSNCEQPVSNVANLRDPLIHTVTACSVSFTWGFEEQTDANACSLSSFPERLRGIYTCSNVSGVPTFQCPVFYILFLLSNIVEKTFLNPTQNPVIVRFLTPIHSLWKIINRFYPRDPFITLTLTFPSLSKFYKIPVTLLLGVIPLSDTTFTGDSVLLQGVELGVIDVPSTRFIKSSNWLMAQS